MDRSIPKRIFLSRIVSHSKLDLRIAVELDLSQMSKLL